MLENRYLDVINFKFDYTWYFSIDDFTYARQIQGLVAKQDFLDLGIDTKAVAIKTFLNTEIICRETNKRLSNSSPGNPDVGAILYMAQRKNDELLGPVPSDDVLDMIISSGGDTVNRGLDFNPRIKLSGSLACSTNLLPALASVLKTLPGICEANNEMIDYHRVYRAYDHNYQTELAQQYWYHYANILQSSQAFKVSVDVVPAEVSVVAKNCKTGRTIVIEPNLNKMRQKGLGSHIRNRLKLAGLDLTKQEPNARAAEKGSIDGTICTLDVVTASDCMTRELVWNQIPYPWASMLDESRSATVNVSKEMASFGLPIGYELELEKFSSMGNGFTFELESLLFYSLTFCTCQFLGLSTEGVRVYGDDIVCPTAAAPLLTEVLAYVGFTINIDKSYTSGPFRESCGSDYLCGVDIRPFYLKSGVSERVLYNMHNWFIRHCEFALAKACYHYVRKATALYGPDNYGDGHLIGAYSTEVSRKHKRRGYCGGSFKSYCLKKRVNHSIQKNDYVFPCYSIYAKSFETEDEDFAYYSKFETDGLMTDPDVIRGFGKPKIISIYTHSSSIFARTNL